MRPRNDVTPPHGITLRADWTLPIVAGLVFILVGYVLATFGPQNPVVLPPAQHPLILTNAVGVYPEPLDRFLYFTLLGVAPVLLAGAALLAARLQTDQAVPLAIFSMLCALILATFLVHDTFPEVSRLFDDGAWLSTAACAGLAWWLNSRPRSQWSRYNLTALRASVALAIILMAGQRIWTLDSAVYHGGPFTSHYEAVTSSIVRIANGGTCLVDVIPQYGCSGELLAPLLHYFGSTVFAVTLTLVAITALSLAAAMHFARAILERTALLTGSLISVTIAVALNLVYDNPDPIFQYYPIRFFFPACSLFAAYWYQKSPSIARSALLGLLGGTSLTWNLESGLAVLGSLGFWILLGQFTARPWRSGRQIAALVARFAVFLAAAALVLLLFKLHLSAKSGVSPDLTKYVQFQQVFYLLGFGMIPIPPFPDYWSIHAGILFCTGLLAATWIGSRQEIRDTKLELATYLAVLGTGLLLYYTGRSHLLVLRLVAWPSTILFFFLLERASLSARSAQSIRMVNAVTFASCMLPAAFLAMTLPAVARLCLTVRNPPIAESRMVRDDIEFIRAKTEEGERVAIIALNQGVLYGESGAQAALEGPGVAEMIRVDERDAQMNALLERGPDKLFVGTELRGAVARAQLGTEIALDFRKLASRYALEAVGPGDRLLLFRRKPFAGEDRLDAYLSAHGTDSEDSH